MGERYKVTIPVPGGYAWWDVIDTESHDYFGEDNFAIVTVSIHTPNAEAIARFICNKLNGVICTMEKP